MLKIRLKIKKVLKSSFLERTCFYFTLRMKTGEIDLIYEHYYRSYRINSNYKLLSEKTR